MRLTSKPEQLYDKTVAFVLSKVSLVNWASPPDKVTSFNVDFKPEGICERVTRSAYIYITFASVPILSLKEVV